MKSVISKAFFLAFIATFHYKFIMAGTIAPSDSALRNIFAADLLSVIVKNKSTENVVYSPASIQAALTLAFVGAEGETAEEMRNVLKLGEGDKEEVIKSYGEYLKRTFKSNDSLDNAPQLKLANRMFVNNRLKLASVFNKIAKDNFDSEAETVDFMHNIETVEKINKWVEEQTNNKIKDILEPDAVDEYTSAVLVNAIYFKGEWLRPFSKSNTRKEKFHLNNREQINVDTMYTDDRFGYVELPELDAKALEMPYKNSNISMMIILPNKVDGLKALETNLRDLDLNTISSRMLIQDVDVCLPKFKITFDIDLKQPLIDLGLKSIFTSEADFSSLFDSEEPQRISDVKHKAFFDVNEGGSEATASTFVTIVPTSFNPNKKIFLADHPFAFAIRSKDSVYFAGHVAKF